MYLYVLLSYNSTLKALFLFLLPCWNPYFCENSSFYYGILKQLCTGIVHRFLLFLIWRKQPYLAGKQAGGQIWEIILTSDDVYNMITFAFVISDVIIFDCYCLQIICFSWASFATLVF